MTPEQIVTQFQQILSTMQRIVAASADLAQRVDIIEQNSGDLMGRLTDIQGSLHLLLDKLETQANTQAGLHREQAQLLSELESRVLALETTVESGRQ